jgi:hypothetical protein
MSRSIPVCLLALTAICASTVLASAQVTSSSTEDSNSNTSSKSPVAFVYVASATSSNSITYQINGFSAAANGALTPIPGSPFPYSVNYMAVNGAWLFGIGANSQNNDGSINSFSIGSNGALTQKDSYTLPSGGGAISVYLDHTGSTLYADYYTTNNDFLSFSIDQSTGALTEIGDLGGGPPDDSPVSFIGNNVYAYSSSCYHFGPEIIGVQRAPDGPLSYISDFNPAFPATKSAGFYCPFLAAADPTNHVAIAMQPMTSNWGVAGPYQLATYTADSTGNLTTTSTYSNMPTTDTADGWDLTDYWMSPSGKFLAVAGNKGLEIFHFNGANPITKFTGLLTRDEIGQLFWDNNNHLYAISGTSGKLFVWTVTSRGAVKAPGSPYSIPNAESLIVLPK